MNVKGLYSFVEKPDVDYVAIRLTEEKYGGFIYRYMSIGFNKLDEDTDDEKMSVNFQYEILENPGDLGDDVLDSPEFAKLLGEIVINVLEESFNAAQPGEVLRETEEETK